MSDATNKNSNSIKWSLQQFDNYRELLIALTICGSWFVLALASSAPAYLATKIFIPGGGDIEYDTITHSLRLLGGLFIVFGLLPILLRAYYETYGSYLRATGILFPKEFQARIVLIVFCIIAGGFFAVDFAQNGLAGLEEHHGMPLWLAAFTSLQPAIVEELLFRGTVFSILRKRFPVWLAILLPAILFGFAHSWWGLDRVVVTVLIGALFALLRWRTNNLWGAMAMHFLVNFGFPIPAWLGWLAALAAAVGLEILQQFRRKTHIEGA